MSERKISLGRGSRIAAIQIALAYRGYRAGAYRGYGGYRYGVGAAAVGAAATGAYYGGYGGGCGYDAYGNWVCPNGY